MAQTKRHLWHLLDTTLTACDAGELDLHAAANWDQFYQHNKTNFFKDRHYLDREFPELSIGSPTILEVGCGVGNTAYPLLEMNKHSKVYACDFAASAVKLVKAHPEYSCGRMHAFVADITCDDLRTEVPAKEVDICTMVFVLSAITPAKLPQALANVASVLKPGSGRVLVRDYAKGDLAQLRLAGPTRHQRISDNFFARSDGTQAYYFTQEMLTGLFKAASFTCDDYRLHERQIENRRQQVVMHRRWVQAVFTYNPPPQLPLQPTATYTQAQEENNRAVSNAGAGTAVAAAAAAADHQPSSRSSSSTRGQQHSGRSGGSASPSDQQPLTTHHQLASEGSLAASQACQQPLSPDASVLACAPQAPWPVQSCSAATCDQQQSLQSQQEHAPGVAIMSGASALERMTQCAAGEAAASSSAAGRQEWEEGATTPEQEPITGCLFADSTLEEVEEDVEIEEGVLVGRVVSVSRQHRHTLEHTGLMRWESSLPLARFLLALPALTHGRQVLELGCGVNPLCCLATLKHCRRYVATDGSLQALQGLTRNLDLNCRNLVMERARASPLAWGNEEQHAAIAGRFGLFDVVIGADVVYAPEAIHSLFKSCRAMLKPAAHARLVLCYIVRRVGEDSIITVAAQFGLTLQSRQLTIMDAANRAMLNGAFRLLVFCQK